MSRWVHQSVQLTAGMVAGTNPVVAAEQGAGNSGKVLVGIQSRCAGAVELGFGAAPSSGQGIPLAAGAFLPMPQQAGTTFNGALYVLGGVAVTDFIVLLYA